MNIILLILFCTQNQYHFLYIAATSMAQMAITADVIPDKPTAPKPTVSSCFFYTLPIVC